MDNEREERAVWLKHHGHNCCQSVIKALTEDDAAISDVEREVLHRAGAGFRTGMGGMEATCGALCGAVMVAGLKLPDTVVAGKAAKQMHERLKSRRPDGRFVCDCDDCVRHGVRVFGEIM